MGKITVGLVSVLAGILAITSVRGQVNYSTLYAIQTIAGSGQYDNIDGTNLDAVFEWPIGITEDTQSNLYVVDEAARTVREIMPMGTNWVVTTIAGSGQFGHVDGIGTNAVFCNLQSISSDAKGNLYVGSGADPSIRMVALVGTNWVVSTIAGSTNGQSGYRDGTNWDALFGTVPIIASDAGGNLFVADFENSLIRKVTPIGTNWVVTTITLSGTGNNPHFSEVTSITVDTHSNLYVTTSSTIEQLKPDGTNYDLNTIAGAYGQSGSADGIGTNALFNRPGGVTVDTNGNIFVSDVINCTLRMIKPVGTNWVVGTIAGLAGTYGNADGIGTNASFHFYANPIGILADKLGRLFVCDMNNHVIRMGWNATVPNLVISISLAISNTAVISWPNTGNFTMQSNGDLTTANWISYAGTVTLSNGTNSVNTALTMSPSFFRLANLFPQ